MPAGYAEAAERTDLHMAGNLQSAQTAKAKLSATKATVVIGSTLTLTVKNLDESQVSAIKWKSNRTSIAKVDQKGVVTPVKVGTTTIKCTITYKDKTKQTLSCTVTVKKRVKATGITINNAKKAASIKVGERVTLKATLSPANTTDQIYWFSSNKAVATVGLTSGKVTAKKEGTVIITAKAGLDKKGATAKTNKVVTEIKIKVLSLVTDAYQQDCQYTSSEYNEQTKRFENMKVAASFHIPQINLTSEDARKVNKEIYDAWYPLIQRIITEVNESGTQDESYGMYYHWYRNGDILSLVAINDTMWDWETKYFIYNFSISSGMLLSKDEVYKTMAYSETEQYDKIRKTLGSAFFDHASFYIEQNGCDDFIIGQFEKTVSDENIKELHPYINESGELCILALVYSSVEDGWEILVVQDSELNPYYENYMKLQEDAKNKPSFINSYKLALLKHPKSTAHYYTLNGEGRVYNQDTEYTLYDIDKDGTPELIIKEDHNKYYIYTFDGNTANLCDDDYLYCSYSNCLYEYEGNGIIIHYGGVGSLHLEYVSICYLSGNSLVGGDTLANTEECSDEELLNVLKKYKLIDDFHPITDDSLLR